jgi:ubiquitin
MKSAKEVTTMPKKERSQSKISQQGVAQDKKASANDTTLNQQDKFPDKGQIDGLEPFTEYDPLDGFANLASPITKGATGVEGLDLAVSKIKKSYLEFDNEFKSHINSDANHFPLSKLESMIMVTNRKISEINHTFYQGSIDGVPEKKNIAKKKGI